MPTQRGSTQEAEHSPGHGLRGDAFGGRKMRRVFLLLKLEIYRDLMCDSSQREGE